MPMPPPITGLKQAGPSVQSTDPSTLAQGFIDRNAALSGGQGQPPAPPTPMVGVGVPMPPAMAGQANQMLSGLARQDFTHDTGVPPNPSAQDIELPIPFDDLMKRAQAIR